ncbi:DUF262 domain-containing protein [Xanthomonas sp. NCPPB 1062]|uniref:GmrSD restriction endonuclease domain-containing protein n=1 Tax=Xanthomonas TaxID=338 RepID=UPI0023E95CEE|nr:hypothetical protein [Xanthomonas campestris]
MPHLPVATAKPDIIVVSELLEAVSSGEYRIPKFQRPYVWSPDDMLQLFDSVLKGYPIGSLLIWQTERAGISSLDSVGPMKVPATGPTLKSYVVDGHQRLATLFGVLMLKEDYPRDVMDQWRWAIAYDLVEQQFVHMKPGAVLGIKHLPLRSVLRTSDFARRARQIASDENLTEEQVNELLDRADTVQRAIREYRLPMTVMKSGSLDDAVTIFARVNQRGREMTADQMISALTYREDEDAAFDLAASIDELLGQLRPRGFGDVPRRLVLQVVLALAGMDFTRPSYEKVVDKSSYQQMKGAVDKASAALDSAAKFLNEVIGLKTSRLLPYSGIFVLLAIFFGALRDLSVSFSDIQRDALKKWFWATSFNGWFAGATTTDVRHAAEMMRELASTGNVPSRMDDVMRQEVRRFPKTFDRRSARIRASLLMQLVAYKPQNPAEQGDVDGAQVFSDEDSANIPYFFPNQSKPYVSSPANRVILPSGFARNARSYFTGISGQTRADEVLASHLISSAAMEALRDDKAERFIELREGEITRAESDFLAKMGLSLDASADRGDEETDAD